MEYRQPGSSGTVVSRKQPAVEAALMQANESLAPLRPAWSAVYSLSLGVAVLTAVEMLPISLLTPMAKSMDISEGAMGQAVTATAIAAFFSSLLIAAVARRVDRRKVLLMLSILQVLSCLVSAVAPNPATLLVGRALVGIALGGFWALSAALAVRLVPEAMVPKALAIIFGGVSVATVTAGPVGSFLGELIGWRGVFMVTAGVAAVDLIWQFRVLPSIPAQGVARLATLLHVLARPQMKMGMLAVILVFAGHFAFFTYLRPFLEGVTHVSVGGVSAILLAFGIGNLIGTAVSGRMISANLRLTLLAVPLLMAALSVALVLFGSAPLVVAALIALWGFGFGSVPVGWSTWMTQTVPDETESGGGVLVAAIQVAITIGAAAGGVLVDSMGVSGAFGGAGILLLATWATVFFGLRRQHTRIHDSR